MANNTNTTGKQSYASWEEGVADSLSDKLEISYSDAQGIIESNEFYMAQAWAKGMDSKQTADFIDSKSSMAKGGGVGRFFNRAKDTAKSKAKEIKRNIALDVIDDTRKKVATKRDVNTLRGASNLVDNRYAKGGEVEDSDDYGTFEIYKNGGNIEVKVVNSDKEYNEKEYDWILGDKDKDGVANADDIKPLDKKRNERIDEPTITTGIKSLISLKKSLDSTMYSFIDELKDIAPNKSKIYARTKTPYSVLDKLIKKRLKTITDLIGTTIVTSDKKELDKVKRYVESGKMGKVIELEDMYENPKGGYRAYHFLIERNGMSVELQLKTKRQKAINELSHEPYKLGKINSQLLLKITETANRADEGDKDAIKEYNDFINQPNIEKVFYAERGGYMAKGGGVRSYEIYHKTLASALEEVEDWAARNGYTFTSEHYFPDVTSGGVKYGETKRFKREVKKDGKNKEGDIAIQVYRMDSGTYELNLYPTFKRGGSIEDENLDMVKSQNKAISHHTKELQSQLNMGKDAPAWVISKVSRASNDLSDVTHYLDGEKMANGGGVGGDTNEVSITITAQHNDERNNKKNAPKKYDVNYLVTLPNKEFIELTGTLNPYHTGRDYDYEFEVDYFADENEENYYEQNNEKIEQEILDKFYSLGKMAKGGNIYKVGDIFYGTPKSTYEEDWQLYKPSISYVIDNKTNKVVSIHSTPFEALKESDKLNPNFKTDFKVYPKEHYQSKMANGGQAGGLKYIQYKGIEIMYEPTYNKYYTNDEEFETLKEAKKYIDSGSPLSAKTINAYRHGAFKDGGVIKGSNNKTGERFGVVIGSENISDEYVENGFELNVRKVYGNRTSESKLIFDEKGNLDGIVDYGYSLDGLPNLSMGRGTHYGADKKKTIQILSEIYTPSFAKNLVQSVYTKMAKGGKLANGGGIETTNEDRYNCYTTGYDGRKNTYGNEDDLTLEDAVDYCWRFSDVKRNFANKEDLEKEIKSTPYGKDNIIASSGNITGVVVYKLVPEKKPIVNNGNSDNEVVSFFKNIDYSKLPPAFSKYIKNEVLTDADLQYLSPKEPIFLEIKKKVENYTNKGATKTTPTTIGENENVKKYNAEIEDLNVLIDIESDESQIAIYKQEIEDLQTLIELES